MALKVELRHWLQFHTAWNNAMFHKSKNFFFFFFHNLRLHIFTTYYLGVFLEILQIFQVGSLSKPHLLSIILVRQVNMVVCAKCLLNYLFSYLEQCSHHECQESKEGRLLLGRAF